MRIFSFFIAAIYKDYTISADGRRGFQPILHKDLLNLTNEIRMQLEVYTIY